MVENGNTFWNILNSKMYVSNNFKVNTGAEMDQFVKTFDQFNPKWNHLLTIDYFYHNHSSDYDGGISFIDRIHKKLGPFHPEWDIVGLKQIIRRSENPEIVYADIIRYLLDDPRDIFYYGI